MSSQPKLSPVEVTLTAAAQMVQQGELVDTIPIGGVPVVRISPTQIQAHEVAKVVNFLEADSPKVQLIADEAGEATRKQLVSDWSEALQMLRPDQYKMEVIGLTRSLFMLEVCPVKK